ncbi:MAG: VIT1/CCC1 transporter family protein [Candidatus Omnitrophica bacterium]|nr:VIT1/CCC1 transporter family protein [Candidatus Omnitrophota bacterium]MDD5429327.1 VIT1/CCC1 transporter family protein [Candidatus Omnitrophota bacterium]
METLDKENKKIILGFQKNEITEYYIYKSLARFVKNPGNRGVLNRISEEELRHYHIWRKYSGQKVKPNNIKRLFYVFVSAVLGVTFGIKLMEKGESNAQVTYEKISKDIPEAGEIQKEEFEHENRLIDMIDEEKLKYMGSVVLGLNDALVEFTGALAGFTFALKSSRLIGMVGLIMGFSASFSMAASEYLSTKTESQGKSPLKASFYTGIAYILTVICLVFPYFAFENYYLSLGLTILFAVFLILVFTFYFSVVKEIPFRNRFFEMLAISMGVAAVSFVIGLLVRKFLSIDV